MPVILKLFYTVHERLVRPSFALIMKATENIVDYKILYEQLRVKYDEQEVRLEGLVHQLAQLQKNDFWQQTRTLCTY